MSENEIDTGGMVYPSYEGITSIDREYKSYQVNDIGITRRDWLIGNNLKGLLSNPEVIGSKMVQEIADGERAGIAIVNCAKRLADLVIAEGKK